MAPPKPPNPSSREIIEEAVNLAQLQLNNAIQDTQMQMDERFHLAATDLAQQVRELQTRFDNEKVISDSRHEAVMSSLHKLLAGKEKQHPDTVHVGTIPVNTIHSGASTVHGGSGTVHNRSGTVHGGSFHTAGIPINSSHPNMVSTPQHTPLRPTPLFSHSPSIPTVNSMLRTPTTQPHSVFTPYIPPPPLYPPNPNIPIFPQPPFPQYANIPPLPPLRTPKLELVMFDGSNPLEWLFQAEQFFSFYNMPHENRLSLIFFYMKDDALGWFKWMHQNSLLSDWVSFTKALELRFGPSSYENHQAELFKLKQEGTVVEYQTKFEKLGNQVVGLPPDAILNCFISGLTIEIQNEMAIHKPTSISQAIDLAKLIESKLKDSKPRFSKPPQNQYGGPNSTFPSSTTKLATTSVSQFPQPTRPANPIVTPKFPIKKLTPAQLQERRAHGLCYNCDENFFIGHKCATAKFLLLMDEEESPQLSTALNASEDQEIFEENHNDTYFQLSTQALTGHFSPQTLKFKGIISGLPVMVLVDTGSTHNILQPRIAQHLNLPTNSIPNFSVMVGNGSHIQCQGICNNVQITLQDKPFHLPFYLLPIEGADVVLGMAWLRTLGPIQADFSIPSITFTHQNTSLTLQADPSSHPLPTTFHQLKQMVHTDSISSFHLMIFNQLDHDPQKLDLTPSPPPNKPIDFHPAISELIQTYSTIFQPPKGLPPPRYHDHHIPLLPNSPPINVKPYRYPHSQKEAMTIIIQDIALNAVTIKERFPIPTIDELLDELGSATIFTKIDLCSGYHQIRVASEDTHKTAFRTFDGHYEFLVMPFGLTNAPSTFQSAMNDLLRPYLRKFVLVFFDDILIYSPTFHDHLVHLQVVFDLLKANSFYAKMSKCVFAVDKVDYLGHVISVGGVAPDPEKVKAILDWPPPRSLTTLRGFLGLTGFYRRFVRNYATLAAPLTDLLRSNKFTWGTEASLSFAELKRQMTGMPVLVLPDFTKTFVVETDASGVAIGAVLSQDGHPIAFFSKKMCPRLQASSVYVREMYAVTEAIKKWRQYLLGQQFHIYTDQKSLRNLLLQKIQTPEQQKWTSKLQGFNFEIFYKPGKTNLVTDALSRKLCDDASLLLAISSPIPDLINKLQHFYTHDAQGRNMLTQFVQRTSTTLQWQKG
ncbi:uncharacterized protein LOC131658827 [Vicia villosa]|uniref:uncharacterized protein LOC131658827 n=1 Tax=Vicia villosa TaxID=3911 RepID=UPI00273CB275|nr:uncharacterized protein LOC131658827 [Vicia villosa]